jgi:xanthine dehydrogenase accessory factor
MESVILVRGSGDVASAVAHLLFREGYKIVIHDVERPAATRRAMAFCDAFFDGEAVLEGVAARMRRTLAEIAAALEAHGEVVVTMLELGELLRGLRPGVLVDARMRKHVQPEVQIGLAPFTVGLGPGFTAGETVDVAVETGWGDDLGRVIRRGGTRPLAGEPQTIAGHARDRYVYAPAAGAFRTALAIGEMVTAGQEVARIGEEVLRAPIDGALRGLTRDGVRVGVRAKVIEVDPRGAEAPIRGIGERPGRIARGALEAVRGRS